MGCGLSNLHEEQDIWSLFGSHAQDPGMFPAAEALLRDRAAARPPFASQAPERRVVRLSRGVPVLLAEPGPNPANDNSAVLVAFQARLGCKALKDVRRLRV
jgi:hypothetical protein